INTRRNAGKRVGEAVTRGNKVPRQAPVVADQVSVNPARLTDGEVRNAFLQMAQSITTQDQAIIAQVAREGAPRENPLVGTMASRLRDFTKMNPPSLLRIQDL
ncbi:hypothetical protein EJD97_006085, partial [Solanum chilense]